MDTIEELLEEIDYRLSEFADDDSLPMIARLQIIVTDIVKERYGLEVAILSTQAMLKDLNNEPMA